MLHDIKLSDYTAELSNQIFGSSGSYGREQCKIVSASAIWDGLAITATFKTKDGPITVPRVLRVGDVFDVPTEATSAAGYYELALEGKDGDTVKVKTTPVAYRVDKSGTTDGKNAVPPTPELVDRFEAQELERQTAEQERETAENDRRTAEGVRERAEAARDEVEGARELAENARELAENARRAAEELRRQYESQRGVAENERADAEAHREYNETLRMEADAAREAEEEDRQKAEAERAAAEVKRNQGEQARNAAETVRNTRVDTAISNAGNAARSANSAADNANTQATRASNAADNANEQANRASNAADNANTQATRANSAADNANTQATRADNAAENADRAADTADKAAADIKAAADRGDFDGKDYTITEADYDAIARKVPTPEVPTKVSELENDARYISENPLSERAYENVWNTSPQATGSNSQQFTGFFNFRVHPIDKSKQFRIKYSAEAWMPNWTEDKLREVGLDPTKFGNGGAAYNYGIHRCATELCYIPMDAKAHLTQITDAVYAHSSYRSLYYMTTAYPKLQNQADDWYYLGWSFYSGYQSYTTTAADWDKLKAVFNRTTIIKILECENCVYEWLDEPIQYLAANLPNHTIGQLSASTAGRTQTGDVNQIDRNSDASYKTSPSAITGYQLLMHTNTGTGINQFSTATASSTAQTKVLANVKFNPWLGLFYYQSSTVRAANTPFAGAALYTNYTSVDLRYSTNCGNNFLKNAAGYDVYLRGTLDDDGMFTIVQKAKTISGKTYNIEVVDSTMLADEEDGYTYIYLGQTVGTNRYSITFSPKHAVFTKTNGVMKYVGTI